MLFARSDIAASFRCRNSPCMVLACCSMASSSSNRWMLFFRSATCFWRRRLVHENLARDSFPRYRSSIAVSVFFSWRRSLSSAICSFFESTSRSNAARSSLSSFFSLATVSESSRSRARTICMCSVIFASFSTTSSRELKDANCSSCAVLTSSVSSAPRSPWIFCMLPSTLGLSCKLRVRTLVDCRRALATLLISSSFAWNFARFDIPFMLRRS
mmetsp:Transcript_46030/g.109796  ORF Transcript_46030/g.109796 Transcript_46030/m.109796 type:complete len:214 (-) Transcript_46030:383-1024(-)